MQEQEAFGGLLQAQFLAQLSPAKQQLRGSPSKCSPHKGSRRASLGSCCTADERRLSAVALPPSHPVSPSGSCSSDGAAGSPARSPRAASPSGSLSFSIPAYRSDAPTPPALRPPQQLATAAAEPPEPPGTQPRVTLNLIVADDSGAAQQLEAVQGELAGLRAQAGQLQAQLRDTRQQAAAPAAAQQQQQQEAERVQLVIQVAEAPAPAQPAAEPGVQPVQLVLNILEQPAQPAAPEPPAAGGDACPASLAAQLARAEACREELARQAGQLKGRIAKLEGAVLAGECRLKAQAAELEAARAQNERLEVALQAAQARWARVAQVGVTPERSRAELQRLAEQAAEAQAAADAAAARLARLEAAREQQELSEFAAAEHQLLTEQERGLAAEAAQWRADAAAATAQLAEARQRLVETDAALLQSDEEAKQLRGELTAAQGAAGAAAEVTAEWRQRAEQYDRDRQAAASNIRKAERELELVAQDNERMFRQLNFVRTRLMGQLASLDPAVPDIGKLARELQSWCDREAAQRARPKA